MNRDVESKKHAGLFPRLCRVGYAPKPWIAPVLSQSGMKAYLAVFRLRFALLLQYRMAAAAGVFTQFFFGLVRVMVMAAFFASSKTPQPLTLAQTITYSWLIQAFLGLLPWNGDAEIIEMIRTGNIAYELCRPVDLYAHWSCRMLSQRLVPTLMRSIPIFIVTGLLLPKPYAMSAPASAVAALAWLAAMLGAVVISVALSNFFTVTTIWTLSGYGITSFFWVVIMLFSGGLVPLQFFPDWMQPLLQWLPFSGVIDAPLRFYIGAYAPSELGSIMLRQTFWAIILIAFGRWLLGRALRRVVIQGG
jgi:ABC-2 type transport system permease protein